MAANLRIDALLQEGIQRLESASDHEDPSATPVLDAEILLAEVLGVRRSRLRSHPETLVEAAQSVRFREAIERRAAGEPLAYIVGAKDFWSLRLAVNPSVLVPRPETELLVERALALCIEPAAKVVDLGTGSGAIALALATERPRWQIIATDQSEAALATARANAAALRRVTADARQPLLARVEFLLGSWFEPLVGHTFHLIISNPPYIAAADPALHNPALKHEPQTALTPGADGLASLRTLIEGAPQYLERDGWLLLEHGADQGVDVRRELVARGFRHVRSHTDLAGHERMTEGRWA